MRLSADTNSEYYHRIANYMDVYLGGSQIKNCIEADTKNGWVITGTINNNEIVKDYTYGEVCLNPTEDAPKSLLRDWISKQDEN